MLGRNATASTGFLGLTVGLAVARHPNATLSVSGLRRLPALPRKYYDCDGSNTTMFKGDGEAERLGQNGYYHPFDSEAMVRKMWSETIILTLHEPSCERADSLSSQRVAANSGCQFTQRNLPRGDEGAKALAAGVAASGSLATLCLYMNQIGDVGAKAIAEALVSSGSLALKTLFVDFQIKKHAQLVAACKPKGVELS